MVKKATNIESALSPKALVGAVGGAAVKSSPDSESEDDAPKSPETRIQELEAQMASLSTSGKREPSGEVAAVGGVPQIRGRSNRNRSGIRGRGGGRNQWRGGNNRGDSQRSRFQRGGHGNYWSRGRTTGTCFRCNDPGHWVNDCPYPPPSQQYPRGAAVGGGRGAGPPPPPQVGGMQFHPSTYGYHPLPNHLPGPPSDSSESGVGGIGPPAGHIPIFLQVSGPL